MQASAAQSQSQSGSMQPMQSMERQGSLSGSQQSGASSQHFRASAKQMVSGRNYSHRTFRHVLGHKHHPTEGVVMQAKFEGGPAFQTMSMHSGGPCKIANREKHQHVRTERDPDMYKTMSLNCPGVNTIMNRAEERMEEVIQIRNADKAADDARTDRTVHEDPNKRPQWRMNLTNGTGFWRERSEGSAPTASSRSTTRPSQRSGGMGGMSSRTHMDSGRSGGSSRSRNLF